MPSQVALSAAGLPTGAVGSFRPMYIPPGTLSSAVTLTIQTPSAALRGPELLRRGWPPVALAGLWWVPWLVWGRRRRGLRIGRGAWCWLGALGMGLSGCGDRVTPYTAPGGTVNQSYSITVTATGTSSSGAALTHSAVVTLVVE